MTIKLDETKMLGFRLEAEGSGGLKMGGKGGGAATGMKMGGKGGLMMGGKGGGTPTGLMMGTKTTAPSGL